MKSGYWEKKKIYGRKPQRRTDHILAVSGDLLITHGGFGDNDHFHDTWHYIIDENRWLRKVHSVHFSFPDSLCTDDLVAIQSDPTCIELDFPDDLKRSNESTLALKYQEILPFREQKGYTPDPDRCILGYRTTLKSSSMSCVESTLSKEYTTRKATGYGWSRRLQTARPLRPRRLALQGSTLEERR
jgi:hypothetical protein